MSEVLEITTIIFQFEKVITCPNTRELYNIQIAYKLNGKNYLKWSQVVCTFLKGKGKLSHLVRIWPRRGDPKFDAWDEQDLIYCKSSN